MTDGYQPLVTTGCLVGLLGGSGASLAGCFLMEPGTVPVQLLALLCVALLAVAVFAFPSWLVTQLNETGGGRSQPRPRAGVAGCCCAHHERGETA